MSEQVIDERVVSMKFDNEEFEKKSAQSLSTIQKLKQALDFKNTVKSLDSVEKASKSFDLSHIGNSVDAIKQKFDGWEVAARAAITNVTNSAVNAAKRMVESVTIDPVRTGLGVYEQKINSVQTMLNNSGESLGKVTEILDDLNEYSDKTIFSLNDMTTALGKFTAQGVSLEKATTIIKGAANEAASMGAGSAEFSRFIYNLTQAYGMGKMTTIDWKSLENAGVAGKKFKDQLVASYEAMAKLGKVTDKYVGKVNSSNLREFLQYGIITADVMTDTFEKYADTTTELGKNAQDAAQQIKTFHQLLDVLAESVASTWSQSFGYIIGDFYEARRLWTNVSKIFEQTVGKMNENRNKLLKAWHDGFVDPAETSLERIKELEQAQRSGAYVGTKDLDARISGRTLLFDGLANVLNAVLRAITPVKEAFQEVFPATTAKGLWEATKNFRDFTAHLKLSDGALKEIKDAAKGVFEILKFGRTVLKDILGALIPATKEVDSLAVVLLKLAGFLGRSVSKVIEAIRSSEGYRNALDGITYAAGIAIKMIGFLLGGLIKLIKAGKDAGVLQKVFGFLGSAIEVVINLLSRLAPAAVTVFRAVGIGVAGVLTLIGKGLEVVEGFFGKLFSGKKSGDESGGNIVAGIAKGVANNEELADKAMTGLASGMAKSFSKELGIESPSKVFMAFGAFLIAGLVIGITKNAGQLAESENVILQFAGNVGNGIASVAEKIKTFLFGVADDSTQLTTYMENAETSLANNSVGLLNKIGDALRQFVGKLKSFNIATIVVVGIIAVLLYNITSLVVTFYKFVDGIRNGFKAVDNVTKGFKSMASAFKRMHSPLVETLKAVAVCVMGIAASIWLLSTLKDSGKLAPALISLIATMGLIVVIVTLVAEYASDNNLEESIKNMALMVIAMSGAFLIMGIAFEQISTTVASILSGQNALAVILSSLGIILAIFAMLVGSQAIMSKFDAKGTIKQTISIIAWAFSIEKVINALKTLIDASKDLKADELGSLWLGGILPILALMAGIAVLGLAFKDTGVGSALTVLTMILAVKVIMAAVGEIPWSDVMAKVKDMQWALLFLGLALALLIEIIGQNGKGMKDFAVGILYLVGAIAGLVLVTKLIQKLELSDDSIKKAIVIAGAIGGLAAVLMIVMHFTDVPVGKFTGFSLMLLALDTVMLALAKTVSIVNKSGDFTQGKESFKTVSLCMMGIITCLGILAFAMAFTKDTPVGKFALVVIGLAGVILALSALANAMEFMDGHHLAAVIGTAIVVFAGLFFLIAAMTHIDDSVKTGPLVALIGGLLVIFGSLVILSNVPAEKLVPAMLSMASLMGVLVLVFLGMSGLKKENTGPAIAAVGALLVIAGSLILLSNYTWDQLSPAVLAMSGVMLSLYLIIKAMANVKAEALGPMIVAVVGVVAVAGSLALLAYFDWPGIYAAAISLSGTLLAVAAAMRIVAGGTGGAGNILASAAAITIVAGSLVIIAYAMNVLKDVPFDYVFMAGIALATIALSLRVLAEHAMGAAIASVAIIAVAAALVLIGAALNVFTLVAAGDVWSAIGMIAIITVALYALSAVAPMAIVAAAALVITSAALVILGAALTIIGKAEAGAGTLALIALALIPLALAGLLLTPGAPGLILAAVGLRILAPALVTMGKAYKDLTGSQLAGLAGGLMAMGVAGVVLTLGAVGLIAGGIGLGFVAIALLDMSKVTIKGKELEAIGDGLKSMAIAGVIGTVGGPGLISLGIGILSLALGLRNMSMQMVAIAEIDFAKLAEDSIKLGANIVEGLIVGISDRLQTLEKVTLLTSSVIEETFRNAMGIHSPSEVFKWLGQKILQGLGIGVSDSALNSGLSDTMKEVANNLLGSFTNSFGSGLSKIGDLFGSGIFGSSQLEKELEEQKKIYNELLAGRDSYYKKYTNPQARASYERRIGTAASKVAALEAQVASTSISSILGDALGIDFSSIGEQFTSLFSGDTFDGIADIASMFEDWDFSIEDVTNSLGGLDIQMDNVDLSNSEMTSNLAKSIDVFSEYDRSLTTTTADIKKNILDNLIGEEEFATNINNLMAAGFDPEIVDSIIEKGKAEGNKIAAALLGGFNAEGEGFRDWYNDLFQKDKKASTKLTFLQEVNKQLQEGSTTIEQAGIKLKDGYQYMNGTMNKVNNDWNRANWGWGDEITQGADDTMAALYDMDERLTEYSADAEKEAEKAAARTENAEAIDQAMSDIADEIQSAIQKHLPSTEFVQIGKNICIGLASGIWGYMNYSTMAIEMSARELINKFMQVTDEHSPSKVFYRLGEYIQEGLANGISDSDEAANSTKEMGDNLLSQFRTVINQIIAIMETDETWQPTIRPVVDFTNIQAGAWDAQNMFNGVKIGAQVTAAANDIQAAKNQAYGTPTVAGMSKEEFRDFLTGFAETIVEGITSNDGKPVEVNVNLEGDAKGIFNVVRDQNTEYKKTSGGRSALA